MSKFSYVEICHKGSEVCVRRFDVTGKTDQHIIRLMRGLEINLDHNCFVVDNIDSDEVLPLGDLDHGGMT